MTKNRKKAKSFDIQEFLSSAGKSRRILKFNKGQVIFSQDDPGDDVLYIQSGNATDHRRSSGQGSSSRIVPH